MDPLDEFELRAFEHMHCTHCVMQAREFLEEQIASGAITIEDIKTMDIEVTNDDD